MHNRLHITPSTRNQELAEKEIYSLKQFLIHKFPETNQVYHNEYDVKRVSPELMRKLSHSILHSHDRVIVESFLHLRPENKENYIKFNFITNHPYENYVLDNFVSFIEESKLAPKPTDSLSPDCQITTNLNYELINDYYIIRLEFNDERNEYDVFFTLRDLSDYLTRLELEKIKDFDNVREDYFIYHEKTTEDLDLLNTDKFMKSITEHLKTCFDDSYKTNFDDASSVSALLREEFKQMNNLTFQVLKKHLMRNFYAYMSESEKLSFRNVLINRVEDVKRIQIDEYKKEYYRLSSELYPLKEKERDLKEQMKTLEKYAYPYK